MKKPGREGEEFCVWTPQPGQRERGGGGGWDSPGRGEGEGEEEGWDEQRRRGEKMKLAAAGNGGGGCFEVKGESFRRIESIAWDAWSLEGFMGLEKEGLGFLW